MISKRELIDAYGDWLGEWTWDLFGSLTFPGYPSVTKAERVFSKWIGDIEKLAGTRKFRYVQVLERGADGENVHFHVLIGGLKPSARRMPLKWAGRWQQIAGYAVIQRFDPDRGGIYYLLKTLVPDSAFAITLHFSEAPGTE
jgi:hypothetical protein